MPIRVEILNPANLQRVRTLLGTQSDEEAVELALEKVIEDYDPATPERLEGDLPDDYWDELFSQPKVPSSLIINAFSKEREDRF
ncbi:MAG TPA: hypothetical protein VL325_02565 [Pyrinomonadaceae bacterium]|jgi:hypothetical protein|nr:hypothetical protein [Pyrinomonadaceae bacterium]